MSNLKSVLRREIEKAYLKPEFIDSILADFSDWEMCFTHKSVDSSKNYEKFEFYGDKMVNGLSSDFVKNTYPEITSIAWLTKIFHYITSNKLLSKIGFRLGYDKYVKVDENWIEETMQQKNIQTKKEFYESKAWSSIIEDIVEAFFGCLKYKIENAGYSKGVAVEVCSRLLYSYYRDSDIDISYDKIFDPITRLKELYQSATIKWQKHFHEDGTSHPNNYLVVTEQKTDRGSVWKGYVYAWPKQKGLQNGIHCPLKNCYRTKNSNSEEFYKKTRAEIVGRSEARTEDEAKWMAAQNALKTLKERYGLDLPSKPMSD